MEFLVLFNTLVLIIAGSFLTYNLAKPGAKSRQAERSKNSSLSDIAGFAF